MDYKNLMGDVDSMLQMNDNEFNKHMQNNNQAKGNNAKGNDTSNVLMAGLTAANPVIGGIAAGLKATLGTAAARKQRKREAEAMYQKNLANIESASQANKTRIRQALGANLAATLRR